MYFSKELKVITVLLLVVMFATFLPLQCFGVELPISAESAVLIDGSSGKIIYEKNAHHKHYPASTTKLMTLVLIMEAIEDGRVKMTDIVTASENAASYGGSQIFLSPGEQLTLKEMVLGIALASGNDASVAVAEHISGTHEAFVEKMNTKAKEIGMKNTHFVNCNGLHDPEHYTTAYDLAILGYYALNFPQLREICSVKHYRIREDIGRPFQYDNKNKLLWQYSGTDGFKTGWTTDAKYCLVATVEKDGLRFVSVVMGVPKKSGHFVDTKVIFNWGYSQFAFKEFYKENEIIGKVKVGKGAKEDVEVVPAKKVGVTLPKGKDKNLSTSIELMSLVEVPVKKDQVLGHISILQDGEIIERINLLAKEDVAKGSWFLQLNKVWKGVVRY